MNNTAKACGGGEHMGGIRSSGEEKPMGNNELFSLKCEHRKWEISLEGELSPGSEELL